MSGRESLVHDHARDGWRLVQIFAPGTAAFGAARYYDLILERKTVDAEAHAEPGGNGVAAEPRTLVAS